MLAVLFRPNRKEGGAVPTTETNYYEGSDRVLSVTTQHDGKTRGSVRVEVESGEHLTLEEARLMARKVRKIAKRLGVRITRIRGHRS